jgi:acid phosphatase (class A)
MHDCLAIVIEASKKRTMHSSRFFRAFSLALLIAASPSFVFAAHYLTSETEPDPLALLPEPPTFGSPEAIADASSAEHVYTTRSAADLALAKDETALSIFHFSRAIGPWFAPGHFPKTEALFLEVEEEARGVTNQAKQH